MSFSWPSNGVGNLPSFQVSGTPFVITSDEGGVTDSPLKLSFPEVTRWVTINNLSAAPMRVGFSENGINAVEDSNYFVLSGSTISPRLEIKCKELYFRRHTAANCTVSVFAGLTNIRSSEMFDLSGSLGIG